MTCEVCGSEADTLVGREEKMACAGCAKIVDSWTPEQRLLTHLVALLDAMVNGTSSVNVTVQNQYLETTQYHSGYE